jgi:hypothetical protein
LLVRWSKRENALLYDGGKSTGGMLAHLFEYAKLGESYSMKEPDEVRTPYGPHDDWLRRTLVKELEARGYDPTTLRFSIRKKVAPDG